MQASATPTRDELLAFELALDEKVCDEVRQESWGRLFLTPSLPLIWDANWCGIEAVGLDLDEVLAIADEALGGEGFKHRTVVPLDEAEGRRLAEEIEADPANRPGWDVERDRFMVWRGPEAPVSSHLSTHTVAKCELTGGGGVREVRLGEIEGLRRELMTENSGPSAPDGLEATVEQLFELDRRYGEAGGDRWFLAPAEGEPLSACRLLRSGGLAQVEEVTTLERGRDRGYGKAIVRAAIASAQAAGDTTIFLTADAADWPQLLYGRLGFETTGEITVLRRRG